MTEEVYPEPETLGDGELVEELIQTNNLVEQQYENRDTADPDEIQHYHRLQSELKERLGDVEWGLDLEGEVESLRFEDLQTGNEIVLNKDGRCKGDIRAELITPNQRNRVRELYEAKNYEKNLFTLGRFMDKYPDDLPSPHMG